MEHDEVIGRLRALGAQPIDDGVAAAHLEHAAATCRGALRRWTSVAASLVVMLGVSAGAIAATRAGGGGFDSISLGAPSDMPRPLACIGPPFAVQPAAGVADRAVEATRFEARRHAHCANTTSTTTTTSTPSTTTTTSTPSTTTTASTPSTTRTSTTMATSTTMPTGATTTASATGPTTTGPSTTAASEPTTTTSTGGHGSGGSPAGPPEDVPGPPADVPGRGPSNPGGPPDTVPAGPPSNLPDGPPVNVPGPPDGVPGATAAGGHPQDGRPGSVAAGGTDAGSGHGGGQSAGQDR